MEEDKIDQSQLAKSIESNIHYTFSTLFLVKPLDVIKVQKEFSVPVVKDTEENTTNEDGIEAKDYDTVATETKEVDSDFRKGIVLKVPDNYISQMADSRYPALPIAVGDTIVYRAQAGKWFDLLKDSQLVANYDIIAKECN